MTQTADAVDEATSASGALRGGIADGTLTEIEVAWSDPFGHSAGKRIPATQFLERATGTGFAFCEAALGWNTDGTVIDSLRLTNWDGGYPDVYAVPDLSTFTRLPWRPGVGHVISDIVTHHRTPSLLDPRAVLRRVLARLDDLGYTAKIGVEFEFYLLETDGSPIIDAIQAYSLENANALDPLIADLYETLGAFTRLEGIQTEYGPGQVETNLVYTDALAAADDSARLKYAAKEVARRHGKLASFMPKPFSEHSGSSAHLHISLWQGDQPAFAAVDGAESQAALYAIAGLFEHLPSITLFGAHSVNAYRRFAPDTFAPDTVNWSRDNRSAAIRSLVEETPRGIADRTTFGRLRFQPLLADRLRAGRGHRGTGGAQAAARGSHREPVRQGRPATRLAGNRGGAGHAGRHHPRDPRAGVGAGLRHDRPQ